MHVHTHSPTTLVSTFYQAINNHDRASITEFVDTWFDPDAAVQFPASLPYGGRLSGAKALRGLFGAMASGRTTQGPKRVNVVDIAGTADRVFAELEFDWYPGGEAAPIASAACEVWTFRGGRVTEIRAYYWDAKQLADVAARSSDQ